MSIDSKNQVFIVNGFRAKRLVELKRGNTWSCDCNSSKTCCHILAVQLAIGILQPNGKMANAENLVRKSRNKRIGKSGRKQPRTIDRDRPKGKRERGSRGSENPSRDLRVGTVSIFPIKLKLPKTFVSKLTLLRKVD